MIGWILGALGAVGLYFWAKDVTASPARPAEPATPPATPPSMPPVTPPLPPPKGVLLTPPPSYAYGPGEQGPPYLSKDLPLEKGVVYDLWFTLTEDASVAEAQETLSRWFTPLGIAISMPAKNGVRYPITVSSVVTTLSAVEWVVSLQRHPTSGPAKLMAPSLEQAREIVLKGMVVIPYYMGRRVLQALPSTVRFNRVTVDPLAPHVDEFQPVQAPSVRGVEDGVESGAMWSRFAPRRMQALRVAPTPRGNIPGTFMYLIPGVPFLSLRDQPSASANVTGTITQGEAFVVNAFHGDWLHGRGQSGRGTAGWVPRNYLRG